MNTSPASTKTVLSGTGPKVTISLPNGEQANVMLINKSGTKIIGLTSKTSIEFAA